MIIYHYNISETMFILFYSVFVKPEFRIVEWKSSVLFGLIQSSFGWVGALL